MCLKSSRKLVKKCFETIFFDSKFFDRSREPLPATQECRNRTIITCKEPLQTIFFFFYLKHMHSTRARYYTIRETQIFWQGLTRYEGQKHIKCKLVRALWDFSSYILIYVLVFVGEIMFWLVVDLNLKLHLNYWHRSCTVSHWSYLWAKWLYYYMWSSTLCTPHFDA